MNKQQMEQIKEGIRTFYKMDTSRLNNVSPTEIADDFGVSHNVIRRVRKQLLEELGIEDARAKGSNVKRTIKSNNTEDNQILEYTEKISKMYYEMEKLKERLRQEEMEKDLALKKLKAKTNDVSRLMHEVNELNRKIRNNGRSNGTTSINGGMDKKTYRMFAGLMHPDSHPNNTEKANEAMKVLNDMWSN